jgi:hypothetical protein
MTGRSRKRVAASLIAVAAAVCSWSASAQAATVTVGSPMSVGFPSSFTSNGSQATVANVALGESGAQVASPVNGTIVQWRVSATGPGHFAIRVLRPSGGHYLGAGRSPQVVSSAGVHTFSANLPIQSGDLIGIDIPDLAIDPEGGINGKSMASGSTFASFNPALVPEGSPSGFQDDFTSQEMFFNADVQYEDTPAPGPNPTPSAPAQKKCKKSKKHKSAAQSAKKKKCKKKKKHG